ncbi:MAG: GNAT family N-acetyltransferase [Candidatus Promineifilaceae bacterium]
MKISRAALTHLDGVATLFNNYRIFYEQDSNLDGCRDYIQQRLSKNESVIFIAENEAGELVGFTQLYHSFCSVAMQPIVYLYDLFVDPSARRTGVGRALMNHATAYSRESGASRMQLDTAHDNMPGQSLYESLGWVRDTHFYAYQLGL